MAGIVEKYIGDAVMAVFGVPVVHEDDALRAVRAAVEMRETLATLNDELERSWGVRLAARIGVNTGEVIAGDHSQGHLFVTGKAVNVAKRLEEAAESSEILIGEATHVLVRDAVLVERGASRTVKHGEAVDGISLHAVVAHAPGHVRRFDSPFVGRERQRRALQSVFEDAVSDRACRLLTVLGGAGVGKSRLVQEFVELLGTEATVLRGRCLPYGEGITYWALAEVVKDVARAEGQDPGEQSLVIATQLVGEEKAELIAERIAEALGLGGPVGGTSEETFWAVRKLFEALARSRPLVVVFDDVHWARADVPRPDRARRGFLARCPHPAALHQSTRAARYTSRLGRRQAERHVDPARAAQRRRVPAVDLEPARPCTTPCGSGVSNCRGRRGQRALRRGDGGDARRRPATDEGGRPLGRVVRPLRPSGPLVDPGAARRPGRGTACRPVGDRHRGLRRGDGVPPWRGERSHSRFVRRRPSSSI